MYYCKDNKGRNIDIDTLSIYNRCPRCGAETLIDEFWDLLDGGQIGLYNSGVHCRSCTQSLVRSGKAVQM